MDLINTIKIIKRFTMVKKVMDQNHTLVIAKEINLQLSFFALSLKGCITACSSLLQLFDKDYLRIW